MVSKLPLVGGKWDPVARRRWLLERLPAGSSGAEIGVWRGDFTAAILAVVRPRTLQLIDPWRSAADAAHSRTLYDVDQDRMDAIHGSVLKRFDDQISSGVVVVHRATSAEAAASIPDGSLEWVYIDGDHTYDGVSADLENYRRKVRPGGLVAGDDYVVGGMFDGSVKRAVDEQVAAGNLALLAQRDRQFLLLRPKTG